MANTLKKSKPHKFSAGDTVKVVASKKGEWCRVGAIHKVRVCKHDRGAPVYVVDNYHEGVWIKECNLELVERDRQKGGEWKRARGSKPKYETETPQRMEVRHRDGDIIRGWTSQSWNWSHNDGCPSADIMAWRIISQPQAEEVEVKGTTIGTLSYKVDVDTSAATQAVDDLAAKWDQIETPFKWRDEVTELNAYIEKYTRERDAIIERLASEGFALIPPVVSVVSEFSGADMSDWRNWQAGDIVECVTGGYTGVYTKGNQYKVEWVKEDCFSVYDDCGEKSSCDWFDHDAEGLKFVRRP